MTRESQIYESRFYEGEHAFYCNFCECRYVTYSFDAEPNEFYDRQMPPNCIHCHEYMQWAGWSGQSDITEGLVRLVDDGHAMAATVMVAAFVEYQLGNLLWAILVDSGLPKQQAATIADDRLARADAVRMIRGLLNRKVKDIVFPIRNRVAHGRGFGRPVEQFTESIEQQFSGIKDWLDSVKNGASPSGYDYKELDRWILSMDHWVSWIDGWWKRRTQPAKTE